jgi:hypothetical protein
MGVSTYRRIGVCKALSTPVLVLGAFLLLGACTSTDSAKKDDPVFFGHAGGGNGGGGAVSGMSMRW